MTDEERRVIEAARAWFIAFRASGIVRADLDPPARDLHDAVEALLVAEAPNESA